MGPVGDFLDPFKKQLVPFFRTAHLSIQSNSCQWSHVEPRQKFGSGLVLWEAEANDMYYVCPVRPGSIWDRSFPERTYWGFQGPIRENDGTCAANRGSRHITRSVEMVQLICCTLV